MNMKRIIVALFFLATGKCVVAQHIQYREKEKPPSKQEKKIETLPKDSVVAEIITPHNQCPAMDASLPVCMNYVPPEIVNKFRVKFEGHCYCITSLKISLTETQYKLRICFNGEFVERYVNTDGIIVR
jgi:hypothetical protein